MHHNRIVEIIPESQHSAAADFRPTVSVKEELRDAGAEQGERGVHVEQVPVAPPLQEARPQTLR